MSKNLSVGEIRRIWRLCIDHLITGRTFGEGSTARFLGTEPRGRGAGGDKGEGRRRPGDRRCQRGCQGEVSEHLVPVVVPPEGAQREGRRCREGDHRGAEVQIGHRQGIDQNPNG